MFEQEKLFEQLTLQVWRVFHERLVQGGQVSFRFYSFEITPLKNHDVKYIVLKVITSQTGGSFNNTESALFEFLVHDIRESIKGVINNV